MAEHAGCNLVLLNLERANSCGSRLPRPLGVIRRRRSLQPNRRQLTNTVSDATSESEPGPVPDAPARLKFPQLEMTRQTSCKHSKIPLPDLSFRTNIKTVEWLKPRPKTSASINIRAYHKDFKSSSADRKNNHLKSIQEPMKRSFSEDQSPTYTRFPTLPAIGLGRPNTAQDSAHNLNIKSFSCDPISEIRSRPQTRHDLTLPEVSTTSYGTELGQVDNSESESNEMDVDTSSRPLIRSETYDILPTVNEEDDDDIDPDTEKIESDNEGNILTAMDAISNLSDSGEDNDNENSSSHLPPISKTK